MWIRFKTSIAAADWSYAVGQVVDLDEQQAQAFIAGGIVEPAPTPYQSDNEKSLRVEILADVHALDRHYAAGDQVDMPAPIAEAWIRANLARVPVPVRTATAEPPAPVTPPAAEAAEAAEPEEVAEQAPAAKPRAAKRK